MLYSSRPSLCLSYSLAFFFFVVLVIEEEEMFHSIIGAITGENDRKKIMGTVVLMKKNVLDFNDLSVVVTLIL